MDHRSVGRPAGTPNIVPGMPGDHPTSIPGSRGRTGSLQSLLNRKLLFFPKIDRWPGLRAPTSASGPRRYPFHPHGALTPHYTKLCPN